MLWLIPFADDIADFVDDAIDVVKNTVKKTCTFENDTMYHVDIVDHDGTFDLGPGMSQHNYLIAGFSVDLIMHIQGKEVKINFPSSDYQQRNHKMSTIFKEHRPTKEIGEVTVIRAFSEWRFAFNHPGGFEVKVSSKVETKNSWKRMKEKGSEYEAKVGGMIKAIELSASFKTHTTLTSTDEYEEAISVSSEAKYTDECKIWQEFIVVVTNQTAPFNRLSIPMDHTCNSERKPGKEKLVFNK